MANFFDQFDAAPGTVPSAPTQPQGAPAGNFFDQFDAPAQAAATPARAAPGQPAPLTIPVPPQAAGSTDPGVNPDGDGLTQDQIDAALRDRFARSSAQGRANLAALPGNINNAVRATANAVPLVGGLANKLDAATSAALGGDYNASLAQQQGQDARFQAEHPYVAGAANLLGAGAGTVAMLPDAALGLGGGSLISRMGAAAAGQGALGGADAAVRGEDVGTGAVLGGIGGLAGPALGAGAGALYRGASRLMAPLPAELQGTGALDRYWLARALKGQSPADLQASADALGPGGFLGERSPGLLDLTQSVATNVGPGKAMVRGAFDARNAGTGGRVMSDVDAALGPAQNPTAVRQGIEDAREAVTAPYFAQAAQNGVPYGPDLAALVSRPAVASALQDAAASAANAGRPLGSITLDAAGNPVSSDAALQAYEAGQRPAVTDALARLTGADPNVGPLAATDALAAQRRAAADPLYAAYRSMNVPMTDDLADVLSRPSVAGAIPAAERKAADQGRSIFAPRGPVAGLERDPFGSGAVPDAPADLPPFAPYEGERAPPRPGPVGVPRPPDLHDLVRSFGGIQDRGGDLAAMGLDHLVARPGQGLGADAMRQLAAQAGYLNHTVDGTTDGATRFSTVQHLFDALQSDHPIHSVFDQDAAAAWAARDEAMDAYNRGGAARGEVGRDAGMRPAAPGFADPGPSAPTGAAARAPQLTPEGLDYLNRALGDRIDAAQRAGNRDDARILTGLRGQLLGAIEAHPDPAIADAYGAARRAYAGPSREMDALNAGREAIADAVTPEAVQRQYGALGTDGERQRFRDGVFSALRDKLGRASDTANFVRTIAGNQALRDKFAAIAPHPGALDSFNAAIGRAQQQFTEATRPTPEALHVTLGALDARAARTGDLGVIAAHDDLAAHLGRDPYYAYGRAQDQSYADLLGAMDEGRTALRTGPNAINPADFADRFGARTGAGQEAERVAMRGDVDSQLRQSRNDYGTMSRLLQGEDGFNAAKIGTAFGEDARAKLLASLLREDTFKANQKAVMGGSPTGERQAVRGLTQPDMQDGLGGWWSNLYIDKPSTYLPKFLSPEALGERFLGGRYEAARERVAPLLTSSGPEADAVIRAMAGRMLRNGGSAPTSADPALLARLLAGGASAARQQALGQ